ncbi:MAG: putative heme d1 biosynthesis radical SAM protein NirJ2 [Clostridiales bacterium]|nr:putative heme d1 biosynthesis radical SAM protein NirJ2 [Clostridiales bacterium]
MIVSWNTTNQCNLSCKHCYRDAGSKRDDELTTAEAKKLIDGLVKAHFKIMIFSGGEPLMRPDIFELTAYARDSGLRPVMGTNGTLITADVAARLKASGVMGVGISLDSADDKAHDRFRGLAGAWQLAVRGMKNCRDAGLGFQIHTTVMDWNEPEIEKLTDFSVDIGASAHHIFFLIPVGRGRFEKSVDVQKYEDLLNRIMEKQKTVNIEIKPTCAPQFTRVAEQIGLETRFSRGCLAGLSYCIINPAGKVQPCAYMDMEIGNVRDVPFNEIWTESEVFQKLRSQKYSGGCGVCAFSGKCGGCRARAMYYNDGDYMAEDNYCILNGGA